MKKFLVFLVALIATVCIGVTFYQFAKNDEVISVNTEAIYINYGDKLSLNDIGFTRKEANKETTFDFNAGGDEVTSIIKFDNETQCYIPTDKGGATTIKIATSNRKYKTLSIDIYVGIGTAENPYYISNEKQLFEVTNSHIAKQAHFKLVNDIELKESHSPIGLIKEEYKEFNGTFNGGYHTIKNLKITNCKYAGLFGMIGSEGSVKNLNISDSKLEGQFENVGTVAGLSSGIIENVIIKNPHIDNKTVNGVTGGVVGVLKGSSTETALNPLATISKTGVQISEEKLTIKANGVLGGLAGNSERALIQACYVNAPLENIAEQTPVTGGLVGNFVVDEKYSQILESYAVCDIESAGNVGNIAGNVSLDSSKNIADINKTLVLVGLYFNNEANKFSGLGNDSLELQSSSNFAVTGETTTKLQKKNTYVYYITKKLETKYWDGAWSRVDGEYPTLVFESRFEDIVINDSNEPINPPTESPETTIPGDIDSSVIVIKNANDLKTHFQTGEKVTGNYIIDADIDLNGCEWKPVQFSGIINGDNHTIKNFTIVRKNSAEVIAYRGFFSKLSASKISNIAFENVKFANENIHDSGVVEVSGAGVVAGHVGAGVLIKNVEVKNSKVKMEALYGGGAFGYVNGQKTTLKNITISNTNVTALNAGGVAGYVSTSPSLSGCNVDTTSTVISGVNLAGGIAAVNHGLIDSCYVYGTIKSENNTSLKYLGGIVAENYGKITHSTCWATINVNNANQDSIYYIGGIAGFNASGANIEYSDIYSSEICAKDSTSTVYIGGLTANNQGNLTYCVADVDTIGSVNKNLHVGGLTVENFGGKIKGCFSFGNRSGYIVAGLVVENSNEGTIDGCMAGKSIDDGIVGETNEWINRVEYKGYYVATFAYEISSGTISNSLVSAKLLCQDNNGWVAGFAGKMPYTKGSKTQPDKYGTIDTCIANISLQNNSVGTIYADITTLDLMKKNRCTGTITNSVISDELSSRYKHSLPDKNKAPGSDSNFVAKSITDMIKINTFTEAGVTNFDIYQDTYFDPFAEEFNHDWVKLADNRIPVPGTIFNVFGEYAFM